MATKKLKNAFEKIDEPKTHKNSLINLDFFVNKDAKIYQDNTTEIVDTSYSEPVQKKTTKRKTTKKKKEEEEDLPFYKSNEPYSDSYKETEALLKGTIYDIDVMQDELRGDIDKVRSSKTLKNKYNYISEMASTRGTLLGTKITAIRELNKSITDSHNLELKRVKDLKLNEDKRDDDKYIMDMYNAFISTPVGNRVPTATLAPNINDMTLSHNVTPGTQSMDYMDSQIMSNNLNSSQNMMRMEFDSNIKTVVVYDSVSGNRWFDVIDVTTNQSVPNVELPDPMFLEDTKLDFANGVASNTNLDKTYPLIIINGGVLNEY